MSFQLLSEPFNRQTIAVIVLTTAITGAMAYYSKQEVFSNQPGENLDQRVVKVRIRLNPEDSKRVDSLTNLQVQAAIRP